MMEMQCALKTERSRTVTLYEGEEEKKENLSLKFRTFFFASTSADVERGVERKVQIYIGIKAMFTFVKYIKKLSK